MAMGGGCWNFAYFMEQNDTLTDSNQVIIHEFDKLELTENKFFVSFIVNG